MKKSYTAPWILGLLLLGNFAAVEGQGADWWRLGGASGLAWESVEDFSLLADDQAVPGALQPWELDPEENLLPRLGPWQRWRFPVDPEFRPGHPRLWNDINHTSQIYAIDTFKFIDGDLNTYVEHRDLPGIFYTIDLGAQLPIERVVFYPPEGVSPESDEPFRPNYILKSYNLTAGNDESTGIMKEELESGFIWRGEGACCPLEKLLVQEGRNRDDITETLFPLQLLRFIRLVAIPDGFTLDTGRPIITRSAFAEMEVYGRGFVPRTVWESQVIDLGRELNFGRVVFGVSTWRKEGESLRQVEEGLADATVEIRTGRDDTPTAYFGFNDLGSPVEVTKSQWDRLIPLETRGATIAVGFRGPFAEDRDNWSFWSVPLREHSTHPKMPWGRYFQLRVELESEGLWDYARVDSLWVETAPLLADRVLGEVVALQELQPQGGRVRVEAGERTDFVYELKAEFANSDRTGFDAVRVLTPAVGEFGSLEMGDPLVAVEPDSVVQEERGFTVYLPGRIGPRSDQRLRIGLGAVLYGEAGEFGGEVFERREENLLQRIESGDASSEIGSDQLLVIATSSSESGVLGRLEMATPIFTPQGDGVNDRLQMDYTLFRVQQGAQVAVTVYALDGRLVRRMEQGLLRSGRHKAEWDGRGEDARLVGPGVYLVEVEVETDKGKVTRLQPVAVAY